MKTCQTCTHFRPSSFERAQGKCAVDEKGAPVASPLDSCLLHEPSNDWQCPRCRSLLALSSEPGQAARRVCPNTYCSFWVSHAAAESLELSTRALPLVTHTIDHMPECPVRAAPLEEVSFNFRTAQKLVDAGCTCSVTLKVNE